MKWFFLCYRWRRTKGWHQSARRSSVTLAWSTGISSGKPRSGGVDRCGRYARRHSDTAERYLASGPASNAPWNLNKEGRVVWMLVVMIEMGWVMNETAEWLLVGMIEMIWVASRLVLIVPWSFYSDEWVVVVVKLVWKKQKYGMLFCVYVCVCSSIYGQSYNDVIIMSE